MKSPFIPCHVTSLKRPKFTVIRECQIAERRTKVHGVGQLARQRHKGTPRLRHRVKFDHVTDRVFGRRGNHRESVVDHSH